MIKLALCLAVALVGCSADADPPPKPRGDPEAHMGFSANSAQPLPPKEKDTVTARAVPPGTATQKLQLLEEQLEWVQKRLPPEVKHDH